jgi:hypothetical protein
MISGVVTMFFGHHSGSAATLGRGASSGCGGMIKAGERCRRLDRPNAPRARRAVRPAPYLPGLFRVHIIRPA